MKFTGMSAAEAADHANEGMLNIPLRAKKLPTDKRRTPQPQMQGEEPTHRTPGENGSG